MPGIYYRSTGKKEESVDEYFLKLSRLSEDCYFKAVRAKVHKAEIIRDVLIKGLLSKSFRQQLLENVTPDLTTVFDPAMALEQPQKRQESYFISQPFW